MVVQLTNGTTYAYSQSTSPSSARRGSRRAWRWKNSDLTLRSHCGRRMTSETNCCRCWLRPFRPKQLIRSTHRERVFFFWMKSLIGFKLDLGDSSYSLAFRRNLDLPPLPRWCASRQLNSKCLPPRAPRSKPTPQRWANTRGAAQMMETPGHQRRHCPRHGSSPNRSQRSSPRRTRKIP